MLKSGRDLISTVCDRLTCYPRGAVLDVGTGEGVLARRLAELEFHVSACDIGPVPAWCKQSNVEYVRCNLSEGIPFPEGRFDYVVCLEVIEHLENPFALCRELCRVLKPGGLAFVSTPNILKIRSRVQFLLEGSFVFFDLPLIEWDQRGGGPYMHVNPIRYHELEYYLYKAGLALEAVFTSEKSYGWRILFPLELLIKLRLWMKDMKSKRRNRTPFSRLRSRIATDDLLYGAHLVVAARKP